MTKYMKYSTRLPTKERPWKIHPIWRGIGCLMMFIIPIMSLAGGYLFAEYNMTAGLIPFSYEFTRAVTIPGINYTVQHMFATLASGFVLMILGFSLLMVVYAAIYSFMGPKRFGGVNAPPERRKTKPSR